MRFVVLIDGDRISKAISLERAIKLFERVQRNNPDKNVSIGHAEDH